MHEHITGEALHWMSRYPTSSQGKPSYWKELKLLVYSFLICNSTPVGTNTILIKVVIIALRGYQLIFIFFAYSFILEMPGYDIFQKKNGKKLPTFKIPEMAKIRFFWEINKQLISFVLVGPLTQISVPLSLSPPHLGWPDRRPFLVLLSPDQFKVQCWLMHRAGINRFPMGICLWFLAVPQAPCSFGWHWARAEMIPGSTQAAG